MKVGDIVHYWPVGTECGPKPETGPLAGVVASIDGDRANLCVLSLAGVPYTTKDTPVIADGDPTPEEGGYATLLHAAATAAPPSTKKIAKTPKGE